MTTLVGFSNSAFLILFRQSLKIQGEHDPGEIMLCFLCVCARIKIMGENIEKREPKNGGEYYA